MGVHRFAPTLAIYGDTGWIPSQFRRWINMIRFWNRVLSFDEERITKIVFEFDYNRCRNNWCCDLKEVFHILELDNYFESKLMVDIDLVQSKIHTYYSNYWSNEILNISKLRTFVIFKTVFGRENYLFLDMPKYLRSTLAQFRCGIIPIRIETGRFQGEPIEERICVFCSNRNVEDEFHFYYIVLCITIIVKKNYLKILVLISQKKFQMMNYYVCSLSIILVRLPNIYTPLLREDNQLYLSNEL